MPIPYTFAGLNALQAAVTHSHTCAPSSIQKSLFPPDVSSVGPRQNIAKQKLGTASRFSTKSNISHSGIPTPTVPISRPIIPHVPSSPLTKLCQSQWIADLGILDDKVYPVDGPARNTCSQTQVHTITQEAVLACIHNYGKPTNAMSQLAMQHYGSTPPTCSMLSSIKLWATSWKCGTSS